MVIPMNLRRVLSADLVDPDLQATAKDEVIDELLSILFATGKVTDQQRARQSILDRERKMSTGMEHGIAIPHGKTDAVDELVACVGISRTGVDFGSLDGEPAQILIMTLSPANRTGPHIQFLAEISRLLRDPERRERVREAQTSEAVLEAFLS
jgi:PTS system nitrogen regulatory IIA component